MNAVANPKGWPGDREPISPAGVQVWVCVECWTVLGPVLTDEVRCPCDIYVADCQRMSIQEVAARIRAQVKTGADLLRRYRDQVPLGHQPHMAAGLVDEWLIKNG